MESNKIKICNWLINEKKIHHQFFHYFIQFEFRFLYKFWIEVENWIKLNWMELKGIENDVRKQPTRWKETLKSCVEREVKENYSKSDFSEVGIESHVDPIVE